MTVAQSEISHNNVQQAGIRKTVIVLCALIALLLGLFLNKVLSPRVLSPAEMVNNGAIMFETPREFKPFSLVNHQNEPFTVEQFEGKWTLVFFGFTFCPDICPTTLATLNKFYQELAGDDILQDTQVVLVSVDPARDTPERMAEYTTYFNKDFMGVTGEFLAIHSFATQLNVAFKKVMLEGDDYTVDHSGNIALVNPKGHYHGFFKAPIDLSKLLLTYQSARIAADF